MSFALKTFVTMKFKTSPSREEKVHGANGHLWQTPFCNANAFTMVLINQIATFVPLKYNTITISMNFLAIPFPP